MRELIAFVRRDALVAASYRASSVLSLASLLTMVVPLYFIAGAIQPVVGPAIAGEGGHYFAFAVLGMATYQFVSTAVAAVPTAVASGIRSGTFEALLATPTRLPVLVAGMLGYPFLWCVARALVVVLAGWMLGAEFAVERLGVAILIWGFITLAYLPFGLLASALLIVTRTAGPLPNAVMTVSMLLGGVYYPTSVIPSWIRDVADVVPLTYGLRALRRVLSGDASFADVAPDLAALSVLTAVLLTGAAVALRLALAHARRTGTLAQY
jgi:ABC-2 type transport system permease protein